MGTHSPSSDFKNKLTSSLHFNFHDGHRIIPRNITSKKLVLLKYHILSYLMEDLHSGKG